jgi:hypothetical protein
MINDLILDPPPSQEEVWAAVAHEPWQDFRRSLKGTTTEHKLAKLRWWLYHGHRDRKVRVQVHNYVGALKRGGQLSATGAIQR